MRLASFHYQGKDHVGIEADEGHIAPLGFDDMNALIAGGHTALEEARAGLRAPSRRIPIADITWHPPVRRPGKIVCVAINNNAADDRKISAPNHPMIFLKPATCLIGHKQPIEVRPYYRRLHPEPELALVVSKRCKDLDPRRADDYVFGYTIMNDITGNDMRGEDRVHYFALYPSKDDPDKVERVEQHLSYAARYKGTDGFGPMGPWLVTRDAVPEPTNLDIRCTLGGELLTEDNTRHYTYTYAEVMAWISRFMTLEPGDVISLGTAFRAGKTGGRPLHTGDLSRFDGPVEVTITGLGTLSNGVKREPAANLPDWRLKR
ncbi:MAG TPA: fumarylacetoacetate hydrolase family protein [Alphaproteobacteria bacterium]|nr:fumarylacetoacetate hydrolase family protein [Alphaproteobacteria bacterium]